MPDAEDLITFTDAAEDLDCGRTTLYRAANDGRLNTVKVGDRKVLVKDEKYESFEPEWRGRRVNQQGERDPDVNE
jgi:excisionase family DNA binding protein